YIQRLEHRPGWWRLQARRERDRSGRRDEPGVQHHPAAMTSVDTPSSGRDPVDAAARDDLRGLFELETVHRRGSASLVCLARDLEFDQPVALKVIPRAPGAGTGPEAEEAFHRAAALVAALDHPHIVPLYSVGATERSPGTVGRRGGSRTARLSRSPKAGAVPKRTNTLLQPCCRPLSPRRGRGSRRSLPGRSSARSTPHPRRGSRACAISPPR